MLDGSLTLPMQMQAQLTQNEYRPYRDGVPTIVVASTSASETGRLIDLKAFTADGTGKFVQIRIEVKPPVNWGAINLLESWMREYGNSEAPTFKEEIAELKNSRLSLHGR